MACRVGRLISLQQSISGVKLPMQAQEGKDTLSRAANGVIESMYPFRGMERTRTSVICEVVPVL